MIKTIYGEEKAYSPAGDTSVWTVDPNVTTRPLKERANSTMSENLKYDQFIQYLFPSDQDDYEEKVKCGGTEKKSAYLEEAQPHHWSELKVLQWLESQGYGFLAVLFKRSKIDGARLSILDDEYLRSMKVPRNFREDLNSRINALFREHYGVSADSPASSKRSSAVSTDSLSIYNHLLMRPKSRTSNSSTKLGSSDCSYLYDDLKARPFQPFNPADPLIQYYLNHKRVGSQEFDVGLPVSVVQRTSADVMTPKKEHWPSRMRAKSVRVLHSRERDLFIGAVKNDASSTRRLSMGSLELQRHIPGFFGGSKDRVTNVISSSFPIRELFPCEENKGLSNFQ